MEVLYLITNFVEGKYYLLTGKGGNWSDYDGPFDNIKEVVAHMAELCDEWVSPEMVNSAVVVVFKNNMLNLVKDDNGSPINGSMIYWKNTIWHGNEIIYE